MYDFSMDAELMRNERVHCLSSLPSLCLDMEDNSAAPSTRVLSVGSLSSSLGSCVRRNGPAPRKVRDPNSRVTSLPGVLQVHELLGIGSFSYVYSCTVEGMQDRVAVKLLAESDKTLEEHREIMLLNRLQHPNLVRILSVVEADASTIQALIFELCEGGSLQEVLHGRFGGAEYLSNVTVQARARATLDVAFAISYLHDQDIVHRDVKSGNVYLVQPIPPDPGRLPPMKLGDLGFARSVERMMTRGIGTVRYMAPEVISSGLYGLPADIYSAGVLLYELLSGQLPYGREKINDAVLAMAILRGQRPDFNLLPADVSEGSSLRTLLEACLQTEPAHRLCASEFVERLAVQVGASQTRQ